ncbi:MAG: cell wall/surface repeat protein, partial [Acidobacteria bacterium]|nr:cell wall/surface repeat protein [Acidobacteriota bacterium]
DLQLSSTGANTSPSAAFNGTSYLVVWTRTLADGTAQTVGRRLSPAGIVLDDSDIVLGDALPFRGPYAISDGPRVTSDGTNWLVAWTRPTPQRGCFSFSRIGLFVSRVSLTGAVLDPGGVAVENPAGATYDQADPSLGWTGSRYVLAWASSCGGTGKMPVVRGIVAAAMDADLSHLDVEKMSPEGSSALALAYTKPRVAAGANRALIAWQRSSREGSTVEGRIIGDRLPVASSRRRAAVSRGADPLSLTGLFLDAGLDPDGHFFILTEKTIPFAPLYQGVFLTPIDDTGTPAPEQFRFVVEPGEVFTGRAVRRGPSIWLTEQRWVILAAAQRLYARTFE